jgi:hypothetical protein
LPDPVGHRLGTAWKSYSAGKKVNIITRELRAELARNIALFVGSAENRTTDIPV